jgi:hypothetical protein
MSRSLCKHTEKVLFPTQYTLREYPGYEQSEASAFFAFRWRSFRLIDLNLKSKSLTSIPLQLPLFWSWEFFRNRGYFKKCDLFRNKSQITEYLSLLRDRPAQPSFKKERVDPDYSRTKRYPDPGTSPPWCAGWEDKRDPKTMDPSRPDFVSTFPIHGSSFQIGSRGNIGQDVSCEAGIFYFSVLAKSFVVGENLCHNSSHEMFIW